ncbi:MAG: DUF4276 family protein [Verrucomicrobia bacterium]|nr:DUF4276 family protein [Verrucomicrobiota bacterium]MCH8511826.1 DUF4276 family protein [Kiritimatiellia bacterium]
MRTLVCCLEEPSAWELLQVVLPKLLPEDVFLQPMVFEGKQDLEKRLHHRIRHWQKPHSLFLVMRDQDAEECEIVKQRLVEKIEKTDKQPATIIRIACRELEAFYLGDLKAVEQGLKVKGLSRKQQSKKYRQPDSTQSPKQELRQLTNNRYQPISGSRAISPHLDLTGVNRSHSFGVLIEGIRRLTRDGPHI